MKTFFFSKMAIVGLVSLLSLTQKAQAQVSCPYTINNNLSCQVVVRYTVYDRFCNVCYTSMDIVIAGGNSYTIPCSAFTCGSSCDLDLLVVLDNNQNVFSNINSGTGNVGLFGAPCSGTDFMTWSPTAVNINP